MGERVSIRARKRLEVPSAYFDPAVSTSGNVGNGKEHPIGFTAQELGHLLYGPKTYKANGFSGSAFQEAFFTSASTLNEPILELPTLPEDQPTQTELSLLTPNGSVYNNSKTVGESFQAPPPDVTSYSQGVVASVLLGGPILKVNNLYYPRLVITLGSGIATWAGGNESISASSVHFNPPPDTYGLVSVELVSYNFLGKPLTLELIKSSDFYNPEDPEAPPPFENVSMNVGSGISVDKWWTYGNSTGGPVFSDNGQAISNPFA